MECLREFKEFFGKFLKKSQEESQEKLSEKYTNRGKFERDTWRNLCEEFLLKSFLKFFDES